MEFKSVKQFHERINMIFNISIALPLLPMGFIFLELNHNEWMPSMQGNMLIMGLCLVSALLVVLFAYTHYRGNLELVREKNGLSEQFSALFGEYRKLYLLSLLAGTLLGVGYYLTGSEYIIGTYVVLLFALSLFRPYYERYNRDLHLTGDIAKEVRRMTLSFGDR